MFDLKTTLGMRAIILVDISSDINSFDWKIYSINIKDLNLIINLENNLRRVIFKFKYVKTRMKYVIRTTQMFTDIILQSQLSRGLKII